MLLVQVLCAVIYVGPQTKLVLNSSAPPHKRSKMELGMNQIMYSIFAVQFVICFFFACLSVAFYESNGDRWFVLSLHVLFVWRSIDWID